MTQTTSNQQKPDCFGVLDKVFPKDGQGIREITPECWDCPQRIDCLKKAVAQGPGHQEIEEEKIAREEKITGGVSGFLKRWSRLKKIKSREDS